MDTAGRHQHGCSGAIEDDADGTRVLRCECGWRTAPARTAEDLGVQWDVHRSEHP